MPNNLPTNKTLYEQGVKEGKQKAIAKPDAVATPQWWRASDEALPGAVLAQCMAIAKAEVNRLETYNICMRLYGGQEGSDMAKVNTMAGPSRERMGFNLISSCIDTLTSKLAKTKPKPFFLTSAGNSKQVRQAKKLNTLTDGIFYENAAYAKLPLCFRNAAISGTGFIWVGQDFGRVRFEHVQSTEILVDYMECFHGPEFCKTLHRVRDMDRTALQARYPQHQDHIAKLGNTNFLLIGADKSVADTVTVIESWRLPSSPDAKDGTYCVTADRIMLERNSKFERQTFPFGVFRYSPRPQGFWGQGLAEQLMPIQFELNQILMTMQRSYYLGGSYKILRHISSKIPTSQFDGNVGTIIDWSGTVEPKYITPPLVQPEMYRQCEMLKQYGYQQSGISALSAAAQKPAGLDAARALREMNDIESDRFTYTSQMYEDLALQLAGLSAEEALAIAKENPDYEVKSPDKRYIQKAKIGEIDLPLDAFVTQCFPISKLPSDPAGRLDTITEAAEAGFIEKSTARRLLDWPDLAAEENLANASEDYLHSLLDKIVDDGEEQSVEPDDNLVLAQRLANEYLQQGKLNNLEPERIQMLRDFITSITQMTPPPAGMPMGDPSAPPPPGGAPTGVPGAPPVSDLLPTAPVGGAV